MPLGDFDVNGGVDVVAIVANEGRLGPLDAAVVEQHVLSLAPVISAVHSLDVVAGRIRVGGAMAFSIVAVGGNRVLRWCRWRMSELSQNAWHRSVRRRILVGEGVAEGRACRT